MTISVIVSVYNIENYVSKCIESLVHQTYTNYEIILVDDGSTDGSGKICDKYQENYSDIVTYHKENGGLSDARNYGVQRAQGEYLLFVDGDDYISENALQLMAEDISCNHSDIVLSEGMYEVKNDESRLVKHFDRENFQGISGELALSLTSAIYPNWSACGKSFRRGFWNENNFEFKKGRLSEDFQLIDRVVLCAKSVSMIESYYHYQYRESSIVHVHNAKKVYDMIENLKEWNNYLENTMLNQRMRHQIYAMHSGVLCHNVLGYIFLVEKKDRKRLLNETKSCLQCLKYGQTSECKIIRTSIKILGLKWTCWLLGVIKRYRLKKG